MTKRKVTDDQIKKALILKHGLYTVAARHLKMDKSSIKERIDRSSDLYNLWSNYKEDRIEEAEHKLFQLITGEVSQKETCVAAILFFLKTQAKEKGYGQEEVKVMNESYVKSFMDHQKEIYRKEQQKSADRGRVDSSKSTKSP